MPKSAAFIRIKSAVLAVTRAIPPGRVTTYKAVGMHLDVMPRHVAYILSQLTPEEQADTPWYRLVGDDGRLTRAQHDALGVSQRDHLAAEGVIVAADGRLPDFGDLFFELDEISTGVHPVPRMTGEDAPPSSR